MKVQQLYSYGNSVRITKDSPNYCKKCVYKIVLSTEEETRAFFMVRVLNKVLNLSGGQLNFWILMFQELPAGEKRCYSLDVPDSKVNENIIMHTSIYSGSLELRYYPENKLVKDTYVKWNPNLFNEVKLTPSERKIIDSNLSIINVCLIAQRDSSYSFSMVFENEIESTQTYSYITAGILYLI